MAEEEISNNNERETRPIDAPTARLVTDTVLHELGNSLAYGGYLELLLDDLTLSPQQRDMIKESWSGIGRAGEILQALAEFAKTDPTEVLLKDFGGKKIIDLSPFTKSSEE